MPGSIRRRLALAADAGAGRWEDHRVLLRRSWPPHIRTGRWRHVHRGHDPDAEPPACDRRHTRDPPRPRGDRCVRWCVTTRRRGTDGFDDCAGRQRRRVRPARVAHDGGLPTIDGVDPISSASTSTHPGRLLCDAPVVMWVHGGGYAVGDKANQMTDKVRLAREQGWILVSVNYRLTNPGSRGRRSTPTTTTTSPRPSQWVHANIANYGGDPTASRCSDTRPAPTSSRTW